MYVGAAAGRDLITMHMLLKSQPRKDASGLQIRSSVNGTNLVVHPMPSCNLSSMLDRLSRMEIYIFKNLHLL